jgi:hypothetical protein
MYIKALLLVTALGATALPAAAQGYRNNDINCRERSENRAGGAVLGAILGGVLGSNVAAGGHRGDGTALGAVLGGVVGSEVGRSSTPCGPRYGAQGNYPVNSYPATQYPGAGYPPPPPGTYSPYQNGGYAPPPPADYGYYPEDQYGDDSRYEPEYDRGGKDHRGVYGKGNRSYNQNGDYAGRDCDTATQITRLPDGSEIRRPVEACRNLRYGDWHVRD